MCTQRTIVTELVRIASQSTGTNVPFGPMAKPVGCCIQLLLARIQKDDRSVPREIATVASR